MGLFDVVKRVGSALYDHALEQQAKQMQQASRDARAQSRAAPTIEGKTLSQWESSWRSIGTLDSADLSAVNKAIGIYRARLEGSIVYVGRAIEVSNGGFRKRLSDYTRKSDSARQTDAGHSMHEHSEMLAIDILETETVDAAAKLERYFVGKYQPRWNKMLR